MTEKFGLTYRAEFFNILNKANFAYPGLSVGSLTAGTIRSVFTTGRQIQFALRLHWNVAGPAVGPTVLDT